MKPLSRPDFPFDKPDKCQEARRARPKIVYPAKKETQQAFGGVFRR